MSISIRRRCNVGTLWFLLVCPAAPTIHSSLAGPANTNTVPVTQGRHHDLHVRAFSRRLVEFVNEVAGTSKELRRLIDILAASDVVVYVTCDSGLPPAARGRLSFVATAGGRRYLMVRLRPGASRSEQAAAVGHELQHAVEIAGASAIVDDESLAREYMRMGFLISSDGNQRTFETRAAVHVSTRIRSEYQTAMRLDPCEGMNGSRLRAHTSSPGSNGVVVD